MDKTARTIQARSYQSNAGTKQLGTNLKAWVLTILQELYYNKQQRNKRFVDNSGDINKLEFLFALASPQESSLDRCDSNSRIGGGFLLIEVLADG